MLQVTAIGDAVREIAARVGPAVVGLGRGWGRGCGVVIGPNLVLTSAHVLRGPEVVVRVGDTLTHGRVHGVIAGVELALIAADTGDTEPIAWDPARRPELGTPVFALADPGGRGLRVTFGTVSSAPGRRAIEHTAPLPRGSSGGPLVDHEGHLLGINSVRLEGGLILAAPASERVRAIARGEQPSRPRLGVALNRNLVVRAVQDASPAAVAGVRTGDRLLAADDRALRGADDVLDALETASTLTLTIERSGEQRDLVLQFVK